MSANKGDKPETIHKFSMRAKTKAAVSENERARNYKKGLSKKFQMKLFDRRTIA